MIINKWFQRQKGSGTSFSLRVLFLKVVFEAFDLLIKQEKIEKYYPQSERMEKRERREGKEDDIILGNGYSGSNG